jgi:tRNA G10  N-methylase Trm11
MPTYLVRLAQSHESFRKVELQALADVAGVVIDFIKYEEDVGHFDFFPDIHCVFVLTLHDWSLFITSRKLSRSNIDSLHIAS